MIRRAELRRVRLGSWVWVPVLATLALGASALGSPQERNGMPGSSRSTTVPVDHRQLVCPDATFRDKTRSQVAVLSADFDGAESGGTIAAGAGRVRPLDLVRGRPVLLPPKASVGTVVVADGPAAQALQAVRFDAGKTVSGAVECGPPSADWWFSGAGASVTRTSTLFLHNVDAGDATLHIRVFARDGEIPPAPSADLVLRAGERKRIDLSLLAPFNDKLTVWVHADRGRVAASMLQRVRGKALSQEAVSWLSGRADPSRSTSLVADFSAAKSATVLLTNPSSREAIVSFEVAGQNGWFGSPDLDTLTLGPGQVASVDVSKAVGRRASAVRVTADRPIVATARLVGSADVADVEPAVTFGAATYVVVPEGTRSTLTLLGGGQPGTVSMSALDQRGRQVADQTLSLPSGATTALRVPKDAVLLRLTPLVGTVSASLTVESPGLSVLSVRGLLVSVTQPAILPFHG